MKKILFTVFVLYLTTIFGQENYVVLLSLDGFRHDYIEKYDTKNIKAIAKKGVRVKRLIPSNPTLTFPNHYTIVTGLYPDHHGIIGNSFYDSKLKKKYKLGDKESVENGAFYGGEPIWNTAKKAGLKTASYFWVGSEADIQGMHPDIWKSYSTKITFEQRIDSVVTWLKRPKIDRPRLITLYYHQPDKYSHKYGPNSPQVEKQVKYVDEQVGVLYKKLMELPIAKQINFIIVSDHGMREVNKSKVVYLYDYISKDDVIDIYDHSPVCTMRIKEGQVDKVYKQLKKIKHIKVYKRGKAPKRYHLATHHRTNDLMIIADKKYTIFKDHNDKFFLKGVHGYLNKDKKMSAIFVATGNVFKEGKTKCTMKNIDIYNLLAHILDIKPAENDGKFRRVKSLLKKEYRKRNK